MPRSILGGELDLIQSDHFETYCRLIIDGTLVESVLGYDPLLSATWSADLDQLVQQATFRLHLGLDAESTSPLVSLAPTLDGRALFDVGRRIALQTACIEPGGIADTGDWHTVFDGVIDEYDPASEPEDDVLTLTARDLMSVVLQDWIEESVPTAGGLMATVLHELFDGREFGFTPTLFGQTNIFFTVVGDPLFEILPSPPNIGPGNRLEIMREIGLANGWDLRGRFGTGIYGADVFVLTYYDPDRTKSTPDWTFDASKYYQVTALQVSRNTVRNVLKVTVNDSARTTVEDADHASIDLYGRAFIEFSELGIGSYINTSEEGFNLLLYAKSDLSQPKATMEVPLPYFWPLELNDLVRFPANSVHHDTDLTLAVTGFTHILSEDGDASTVIQTRGRPAAANRDWRYNKPIDKICRPTDPVGTARPGTIWLKTV
jgi:hypothetical protein